MSAKLRIAVLASGRGSNLAAITENIKQGKIAGEIVLVLSDKKDAVALSNAAKDGIPTKFIDPALYPDRNSYDTALADACEDACAELIVLAGFMRFLTPSFVERFPQKIINIHPALLPSFPGLHGQRQAVEAGVKIAGCTVHFVDTGLDSGPIIAQKAVEVLDDDDEDSLSARILVEEHKLYSKVIADIAEGKIEVRGKKVFHKN